MVCSKSLIGRSVLGLPFALAALSLSCGDGSESTNTSTSETSSGGGGSTGTLSTGGLGGTGTTVTPCTADTANCDGDDSNGCETPIDDDPYNCGVCKKDCDGGQCINAKCQPVQLASGDIDMFDAADCVDDGLYLYWVNRGGGDVWRTITTNPTKFASGTGYGNALAVDATHVYWLHDIYIISSIPKSGGTVQDLHDTAPYIPMKLVGDSDFLYWTEEHAVEVARVSRMQKSTGISEALLTAEEPPYHDYSGALVDSSYFYWYDHGNNVTPQRLMRTTKNGASAQALATDIAPDSYAFCMDADESSLYLAGGEAVYSVPKAGGIPKKLSDLAGSCLDLAVDEEYIYVGQQFEASNRIVRVKKTGGTPEIVGEENGPVSCITANETRINWFVTAKPGLGSVKRLVK